MPKLAFTVTLAQLHEKRRSYGLTKVPVNIILYDSYNLVMFKLDYV